MGNCLGLEEGPSGGSGPSAEERRQLQVAAADRRAKDAAGRGLTNAGAARLQKGQQQQAKEGGGGGGGGGDNGTGMQWRMG